MEELQAQLAQLSPAQVAALLGASGHAQLLQQHQAAPSLSPEEAQAQAERARQRGNESFRRGDFAQAAADYSAALAVDPRNALSLSNRAAALLKASGSEQTIDERQAAERANVALGDFRSAVDDCSAAIDVTPSIKPFMRRATARIELLEFDEAVRDLVAALAFEPDNKECAAKLSNLARRSAPPTPSQLKVGRRARLRAALALSTRRGWQTLAVKGNPAPPALNGHTLFRGAGGRIFLFGGRSVRDQKLQVFALDERDFSWDVAAMSGASPSSRAWHSLSCIDAESSTMCVYGGVSSQGEDPRIHLLAASSDGRVSWSEPASVEGETLSARSGHSAVSISQHSATETFIFGGRTKRGVSDAMYVLRSSKSERGFVCAWEAVARTEPWPPARDGHTMCVLPAATAGGDEEEEVGRKLVLFGGNGQQNEDKMNDTWVFDASARRWEEVEHAGGRDDVPPPRSYHSAHSVGPCVFVIGGRMRDAEDSGVYMFDSVSREWLRVPIPEKSPFAARAWHSSILLDGHRIFLLGGGTFTGPRRDAALLDLSEFAAALVV